jgi:predicted component of type VI protein secretion system
LATGVDPKILGLGNLNIFSNIANDLADAASTLGGVVGSGNSVAASLNQYGVPGLDKARANYKPESMKLGEAVQSCCHDFVTPCAHVRGVLDGSCGFHGCPG